MNDGIPAYDLEDGLLDAAVDAAQVRIYRVDAPQVVLGRGSRAEAEVDLRACREDGVELRRRRGGGCSVVLDPGIVVVAASVPAPGIGDNQRHFDRLCAWLIEGLEAIGVTGVRQAGISDLSLDGRKVAGCCIYRRPGRLLFSAALLVDAQLELLDRYLRHPPREPDYRRGRGHRDFVARLADHPAAPPVDRFAERLSRALGRPPHGELQ